MATSQRQTERAHEIDELLQTSEPVLFAVDQVPFEVESRGVKNTFCLLVPLLTEEGIALRREQFLNRERVWWMLRGELHPDEIRVGMVWSAPIERSREYGSPEPEKDHYQVRRAEVRPGARHFVEVLNLKVAEPDLNELLDPEGVPWPYPPLPRVVVRGGLSVVGPFRAQYDYERGRVVLSALTPGSPCVFRLRRGEFESETGLREFSYVANQWDTKSQERRVELALLHERDLAILERDGERLDGASEAQLVNWALDLMDIPKRDRQRYKEVFQRAGELQGRAETDKFPGRLERFLALSADRERVLALGSKIAEAVATKEGFRELVDMHIEKVSEERVAEEVSRRREEIERATAETEERLRRLEERAAGAQDEYQERLAAWDAEFDERHSDRIRALEDREAALERQEREMVERLERLAAIHREGIDRLGDQLIAQLPLLQRLGAVGGTGAPSPASSPAARALDLPAYLSTSRPRCELEEEDFLRQFEAVAASQGFVFDREDLINFHVLVQTGIWTILTGPSGRGKSSLPRLYAEALGCSSEFLIVPVRPDWLDDRDVVGAFNALSGRFEPAACGLVDRLIAAYEDFRRERGGIYIVCLDEMNLARVEHYFAQFLSLLEQREDDRQLRLYARGLGDPGDPYAPYRNLPLAPNLRFVGTVNIDETTHFFSPKVIDRAPIATFDRPDLRLGLASESEQTPTPTVHPVHHADWVSWIRPMSRSQEAVDLLLRIDEAMQRSRLGLGFRLRDRILRYVGAATPLLGEDRALDLAILQNVVPRLSPTAPLYAELLTDLQSSLPPGRFHRTATALKALSEDPESDFFQLL